MLTNARLREIAKICADFPGVIGNRETGEMAAELLALREADCKSCAFVTPVELNDANHCEKFEDYMPASPFACKHYGEGK